MVITCALSILVLVTGACWGKAGCVVETAIENVGSIPTTATARTAKDVADDKERLFRRHFVEAYESVGDRSPAWDAQALDLLEGLGKHLQGTGGPGADHLLAQTRAVLDAGCDDPLIVYYHGTLLEETGDRAGAEEVMRRGLEGLVASDYPRFRASVAAFELAESYRDLHGEDAAEVGRYRDLSLQLLGESWSDGSFRPNERGLFLSYLDRRWRDLDEEEREDIYRTLSSNQDVDPYVVKVVGLSLIHI